ncbi:uncharacterized protein LOC129412622 [Boleophthalmus pectinirostris]|uniref:uncharacterized protein LOC129412622 n=1 Tax=Boleophthalmus pectinirostris TaxID=150288 RepID=UPI00242DCFD3|nr:uncharacterized protein LOC129412622 [Boleophthalmus pectinirostris]
METIYPAQHLSVQQLKSDPQNGYSNYLHIKVPSYPRPELHVAHLSHCTDQTGIFGILNDSGFRSPGYRGKRVVWFSLTVSRAELKEAEDRPMTIVHSDGTEEQYHPPTSRGTTEGQGDYGSGVLKTFATSPAFSSSSRLGSFCFTFPLQDVLDKYSQQFCGGQKPVMRVWNTVLYKQKVMYAVLVHSPSPTDQEEFCKFPELKEEPGSICAFREEPRPHFLWRPQAMSETHDFELVVNRKQNSLSVEPCSWYDENGKYRLRYFVWDEVALALHVREKVLRFEEPELKGALSFCEMGAPPRPIAGFQSFEEAQREVPWPLQRFSESDFAINP